MCPAERPACPAGNVLLRLFSAGPAGHPAGTIRQKRGIQVN